MASFLSSLLLALGVFSVWPVFAETLLDENAPIVEKQLQARTITVLEWGGARQERLDEHLILVSEYRRKGPHTAAVVREQLNLIPLDNGVVLLSLAYVEEAGNSWRSVVMRIRSSCRLGARGSP